jgi:hypothetical protein
LPIVKAWVLFPLLAIIVVAAPGARATVSNQEVAGSIERAKAFLWSKQKGGTWELGPAPRASMNDNSPEGAQWGGISALATYALLAAGESAQDAKMVAAINFLKGADIRGTYALALRMQVWLLLPPTKETVALMRKDAALLLSMTRSRGSARGMHDYTALGNSYSHSRSQYAVLGAWAAEQLVPESIPARYWREAEAGWIEHQDRDSGGWSYRAPGETQIPCTPGMTAAAVATLFITQDYLHAYQSADCRGNATNPSIEAGVAWLAKNFELVASEQRYARDFPFISLYAVERVGVAGGLKYFGGHDWYEKGVGYALRHQGVDGSFEPPGGDVLGQSDLPVIQTSFAMLFLVRGRAPVAISKVDYGVGDSKKPAPPWNQRPRDVANVVRWMARELERDLNWQVVNLNVSAEELLDSQVLYMAGNQPITLTDAQAQRLKAYVEMGGLVVGHADCANAAFAKSFRQLGQTLFPAGEFRELPATHVIYNAQFRYAAWKTKPQVQGLSNGARELMLLIHGGDPAKLWQTRAVKGREEAWQLMANMFLYANDQKDLRFKGDTYWVRANSAATPPNRKLAVARLQYAGNWDPEPAGWRRVAAIVNNDHSLTLQVNVVTPGEGKLAGYKFAHLTGTAAFTLNEAAVAELRAFVTGGGLLVIDAAGGSGDFADSTDVLLTALFPDSRAKILPVDHALYQSEGKPIPIEYRHFARKNLTGALKTGRLLAVEVGGRAGVVVSREDLSVGLVGQSVDGVIGYAPATATRLMTGLLLSAAPKTLPPATRPAATTTTTKPAGQTVGGPNR